jgi:glycosidase
LTTPTLDIILESLEMNRPRQRAQAYAVPNLWFKGTTGFSIVDPFDYFSNAISSIRALPQSELSRPGRDNLNWSDGATVYNLFVRYNAAFDHDCDGRIGIDPLPDGFMETGTLLKAVAMLPYIRSMGADTLYLLPLTTIGRINRKGALGSPYAIRNPYQLDELLGEPALELPVETQLKALVEAAHHLGMRVVFEFVFRTVAIDSDLIPEHPDWFYWIQNRTELPSYGPPAFDHDTLARIYEQVDKHDFRSLPEPDQTYRERFVPASTDIS